MSDIGSRFGSPPTAPLDVHPSDAEVTFFRENGYLVVEHITTDEEIAWLAGIYEQLFAEGSLDRSGRSDPTVKGTFTQIYHPEIGVPELLTTTYFRNAKRYAAALMGRSLDELTVWSHMLRKAPGAPEARPHQDEAFWPPEYDYDSVAVWLPLHDVSVEMGAMQFVPGSHLGGVRPHRHYDDPLQILMTVDEPLEPAAFVACPLQVGGCTFHHPSTIHRTGPNATDRPRLAYPMTVQALPIRRAEPRSTPWLEEFIAAGGPRQTSYVADGRIVPLPA